MLGLLISITEVQPTIFALGLILFSTIAIMANSSRTAIISLLIAAMFLCGFVGLTSNGIIAVSTMIIYISLTALLATIVTGKSSDGKDTNHGMLFTIAGIFIISLLIYRGTPIKLICENDKPDYEGILEITTMISIMVLMIASGLAILKERK